MPQMQHSSLVRFCDECGLANDPAARSCAACQHPLVSGASSNASVPPIAPVTIAPVPVLEVTPGPLFGGSDQSLPLSLYGYQGVIGELRPGTILNKRYRIEGEIGSGGFSTVYRAVDLDAHSREVAIKRIRLSSLNPRQVIDATETFNREITMLARFKGVSGVPAFYEHLTDAENWYLITQYIPGQTLEEYLQKVPGGYLAEDEVVQLGIGLAGILQQLHAIDPPVIFRDLKPANVMLTPEHHFFLIDFGIARNFTSGKTRDTTALGSPGYAPPEQYGRAQTDQRSDIYSLGATLQTLLTGRDPLELRAGELSLNPKPLSHRLSKLLDTMLAPDPGLRPATMGVVKQRLERIVERRSALSSSLLGMVLGIIVGVGLLIVAFHGFSGGAFTWLGYFALSSVSGVWKYLRKKYNIPKASSQYVVFGVLAALVPLLVIWLWHTFWWPF